MKLTATEPGFYKGERIRAGATFEFDETGGKPLPRWAVPEGTPLLVKEESIPFDTKPPGAIAASNAKTSARGDAPSAHDIKPAEAATVSRRKSGAGTFPTSLA